jgi:hypothetical protein
MNSVTSEPPREAVEGATRVPDVVAMKHGNPAKVPPVRVTLVKRSPSSTPMAYGALLASGSTQSSTNDTK